MEIKANSTWINKKNGREYEVIKEAIDCTNERDGLIVVVYICKEVEGNFCERKERVFK